MKSNKEVMRIALKYVGQGGARFRKFAGLPNGAAWCNAYVDYVAYEGGVSSLYFNGKKETYCPTSIKWCKSNLAQIPPYLAMPMDIIYFDWDKNGVPNHIGLVHERVSTSTISTVEGNTNGGIVAKKNRSCSYSCGIFRPHYTGSYKLGKLKVDGVFYYSSIANLSRALGLTPSPILTKNVVKKLQTKVGAKADGAWGPDTSGKIQKYLKARGYYKGKIDKAFGKESTKALQRLVNAINTNEVTPEPKPIPEPTPEPTRPQTKTEKILSKINEYAYPYGTSPSKYKYKGGAPRSAYKSALKKYMNKTAKISQSDCGYFVSTVIRACGISKSFLALRGRKESFQAVPSSMKIVHKGKKIPSGLLKAGDVIRYKKTGGGQHTLMYYGGGKIAEAGRKHYFPAIKKDTKKYNKSNVKKSTIQVLRAKE